MTFILHWGPWHTVKLHSSTSNVPNFIRIWQTNADRQIRQHIGFITLNQLKSPT